MFVYKHHLANIKHMTFRTHSTQSTDTFNNLFFYNLLLLYSIFPVNIHHKLFQAKHPKFVNLVAFQFYYKLNSSVLSGGGWRLCRRRRRNNHWHRRKRRHGHFRFGRDQSFQWVILEHLELVHDTFSVEVDVENVWQLLHENFCHLYGSHYHTVVLCLQHSCQVAKKKLGETLVIIEEQSIIVLV